jgi:hypothetical protein
MGPFCDIEPRFRKAGRLACIAVFLTLLSFAMIVLEYGVFNFGDSELPPYKPDTPFEFLCVRDCFCYMLLHYFLELGSGSWLKYRTAPSPASALRLHFGGLLRGVGDPECSAI